MEVRGRKGEEEEGRGSMPKTLSRKGGGGGEMFIVAASEHWQQTVS